jgi:hypothetical protein
LGEDDDDEDGDEEESTEESSENEQGAVPLLRFLASLLTGYQLWNPKRVSRTERERISSIYDGLST